MKTVQEKLSLIIDKVSSLTIANGYNADYKYLDGWLIHYFDDLRDPDKPDYYFPAISIRQQKESISTQSRMPEDAISSKNIREFVIELIVDAGSDAVTKATLNNRIESHIRDIKKAISDTKLSGLTIKSLDIGAPEEAINSPIITFECELSYNDKWSN